MPKQKKSFLFSSIFITIIVFASVSFLAINFDFSAFKSGLYGVYHKVENYFSYKWDGFITWTRGRFSASADIEPMPQPELKKVPFDIKSFNEDIEDYILPQRKEETFIMIKPGMSYQEREQERIRKEEEERKRKEEEERRKAMSIEGAGLCSITSSRYIEIDLSSQRLALCNMGSNEGTYAISSGSRQYPTPTGSYRVNSKTLRAYSAKYNLYMPYWNAFIGSSYGIHELPEYPNGYKEGAGLLGRAVSHGCVRLGVGPAAHVYNWAPVGTPVIVHQ